MAALLLVLGVFIKMPAAQGRRALKCVFMNLKLQTLFFWLLFCFSNKPHNELILQVTRKSDSSSERGCSVGLIFGNLGKLLHAL